MNAAVVQLQQTFDKRFIQRYTPSVVSCVVDLKGVIDGECRFELIRAILFHHNET